MGNTLLFTWPFWVRTKKANVYNISLLLDDYCDLYRPQGGQKFSHIHYISNVMYVS